MNEYRLVEALNIIANVLDKVDTEIRILADSVEGYKIDESIDQDIKELKSVIGCIRD